MNLTTDQKQIAEHWQHDSPSVTEVERDYLIGVLLGCDSLGLTKLELDTRAGVVWGWVVGASPWQCTISDLWPWFENISAVTVMCNSGAYVAYGDIDDKVVRSIGKTKLDAIKNLFLAVELGKVELSRTRQLEREYEKKNDIKRLEGM